jgi:ribosomal protein L15
MPLVRLVPKRGFTNKFDYATTIKAMRDQLAMVRR